MTRSLSGALVNKEDYDTKLQRQENTLFSQEPDFPGIPFLSIYFGTNHNQDCSVWGRL